MFEAPIEMTAIGFDGILPGSTCPLLIRARENDTGVERRMVLKLRTPAKNSDGHQGPTSLACELASSMLARAIGLPVPTYAIIHVPDTFHHLIGQAAWKHAARRCAGKNFGSAYHPGWASWNWDVGVDTDDMVDTLEHVLSFDAAIYNEDRQNQNSNLLFKGKNLLMIDHSLAMPVCKWTGEELESDPLLPERAVKGHVAFKALRARRPPFESFFKKWLRSIRQKDIDQLLEIIPSEWQKDDGDLEKLIAFLRRRRSKLTIIRTDLVRLVSI